MTDAAQPSSFIEADSVGIGQCALLSGDAVILTRRCDASLVPTIAFAGGVSQSVQHRGDFIVAVTDGHAPNDV